MTDSAKLTKVTSEAYQGYQEGCQPPYQHGAVIDVENIEIFESGSQFSESRIMKAFREVSQAPGRCDSRLFHPDRVQQIL